MTDSRLSPPLLVATLALLQGVLLAPGFGEYFQGDDLAAVAQSYSTPGEVLAGFVEVDPQGWYRPLPRLLTSIVYGLFGLSPLAFRLVAVSLLVTLSIAVLRTLEVQIADSQAALAATFFFAVHSVHAFTTFGPAFYPELLYVLFYCLSVLFFLKAAGWPQVTGDVRPSTGDRVPRVVSVTLFACALLSKESAVTLPLLLGAILLLAPVRPRPRRFVRLLAPYLVVLIAHLLWLGATWNQRVVLETGGSLVEKAWTAFGWTLNLGDELGAAGPLASSAALLVAVVTALIWLRFLGAGRHLRIGLLALAWVVIPLGPSLILASLKPYYVLLPLVGVGLAFGQAVAGTLHDLAGSRGVLAAALFGAVVLGSGLKISENVAANPLLGGTARQSESLARQALAELPEPPSGAELLVIDQGNPPGSLLWPTAGGQLFELLYAGSRVDVRMTSLGQTFSDAASPALRVLVFRQGRLEEQTEAFRRGEIAVPPFDGWQPPILPAVEGDLTPDAVGAGRGHYTIEVPTFAGETVEVQFTLDGGPVALAVFSLDPQGRARQFVSRRTPKGVYRFLALRVAGEGPWRAIRDRDNGGPLVLTVR